MTPGRQGLTRRDFIRTTALGGTALATLRAAQGAEMGASPKLPMRKLGRTDLEVSVIGYGTEFISDQGLVEHLLAEGVNHVDTAVLYQEGNAERKLAPVLAAHPDTIVATKFLRTIPVDAPKEVFLQDFQGSCERMQREMVDIIYLHDRRTPEAVECLGAKEAFEELRAAGKAKYFGVSAHFAQAAVVQKAVALGWFDVLLVAHNFLSPSADADALKAAVDAGLGVMAMKVCKAISAGQDWYPRASDEQKAILGQTNLFQAAIKWALTREYISAAVLCISNYDEAAEDLAAAREATMGEREARALEVYRKVAGGAVCRGCGRCEAACPRGVPITDILRFASYYECYGQRQFARAKYATLPQQLTYAACKGCWACEARCPYGLPVKHRLKQAHELLV